MPKPPPPRPITICNMMLQAGARWEMRGHASPHARAQSETQYQHELYEQAASASDAVRSHAPHAVV